MLWENQLLIKGVSLLLNSDKSQKLVCNSWIDLNYKKIDQLSTLGQAKMAQGEQKVGALAGFAYASVKLILQANVNR
jgi:hypothetical protein